MLKSARVPKTFLHPGDFHFTDNASHLHTLLGSCIAITLWHPVRKVGGMCHFVLPQRGGPADASYPDGRYGDEAWELFRRAVSARGTKLREYQGKIFGGANMLGNTTTPEEDLVGTRNAERAINMLMDDDVELLVVHVGETGHRRVVLDVESGDVWVRHEAMDGHLMASTTGMS